MQIFKIGTTNNPYLYVEISELNNYFKQNNLNFEAIEADCTKDKCDLIIDWILYDFEYCNGDPDFLKENIKQTLNKSYTKILYPTKICVVSGEPHSFPQKEYYSYQPDYFTLIKGNNYGVSHFIDSPNNCFCPYIGTCIDEAQQKYYPDIKKTKFCAILSSCESIHRRKFINILSKYKPIDIYGKLSENQNNWNLDDDTINKIMSEYKFTLCVENSKSIEGEAYLSEKIIKSFRWNSIPIYYGSDYVTNIFNDNAYINANNLSENELLEIIEKIDNDDSLYSEMLNSNPYRNPNFNYKEYFENKKYEFIKNILTNKI